MNSKDEPLTRQFHCTLYSSCPHLQKKRKDPDENYTYASKKRKDPDENYTYALKKRKDPDENYTYASDLHSNADLKTRQPNEFVGQPEVLF